MLGILPARGKAQAPAAAQPASHLGSEGNANHGRKDDAVDETLLLPYATLSSLYIFSPPYTPQGRVEVKFLDMEISCSRLFSGKIDWVKRHTQMKSF